MLWTTAKAGHKDGVPQSPSQGVPAAGRCVCQIRGLRPSLYYKQVNLLHCKSGHDRLPLSRASGQGLEERLLRSPKLDVLGVHLSSVRLKSWNAQCGVPSLCSARRSSGFWAPPRLCVTVPKVGFMARLCASLLRCPGVFLFPQCAVVTQPAFRFRKEELVPYVAVDSVHGRTSVQALPTSPS